MGIRIAASLEVRYAPGGESSPGAPFVYVPVSVTYRFSGAYGLNFGVIESHMTAMAVNASTGASYVAVLQQEDTAPARREYAGVPRERLEQSFFTRYFTADLEGLLGLPMEEAAYPVHVWLEEHLSNVMTLTLNPAS